MKQTKVLIGAIICVILLGGYVIAADEGVDLKIRLIDQERNGELTDSDRLEGKCLALLDDCSNRADTAAVFTEIAFIYNQNGFNQPNKSIYYCKMALDYTIDISKAIQMYVFWSDALQAILIDSSGIEFTNMRQKITQICLEGLSRLDCVSMPDMRQPLPIVRRISTGLTSDNDEYNKLFALNREEILARDSVSRLNDLIRYRDILLQKCIYLYSQKPYDDEEFKRLTRKVVIDQKNAEYIIRKYYDDMNR